MALLRLFDAVVGILLVHDADEDADVPRAVEIAAVSGVFQGVPGGFEEDPLLGIEDLGLARGDVEEQGIEAVDIVEEAAPLAAGFSGSLSGRGVIEAMVPARGGDLGDRVASGAQVVP